MIFFFCSFSISSCTFPSNSGFRPHTACYNDFAFFASFPPLFFFPSVIFHFYWRFPPLSSGVDRWERQMHWQKNPGVDTSPRGVFFVRGSSISITLYQGSQGIHHGCIKLAEAVWITGTDSSLFSFPFNITLPQSSSSASCTYPLTLSLKIGRLTINKT